MAPDVGSPLSHRRAWTDLIYVQCASDCRQHWYQLLSPGTRCFLQHPEYSQWLNFQRSKISWNNGTNTLHQRSWGMVFRDWSDGSSATAWVTHYSISEIGDAIFHTADKLQTFFSFFSGHFGVRIKDYHSDAHFKLNCSLSVGPCEEPFCSPFGGFLLILMPRTFGSELFLTLYARLDFQNLCILTIHAGLEYISPRSFFLL